MQNNHYNFKCKLKQYFLYFLALTLCSSNIYAFDLDAGIKAMLDPAKNAVNNYYPVAIFVAGSIGALLQQGGDLRDRMVGFGKGALFAGLVTMGVKTAFGI